MKLDVVMTSLLILFIVFIGGTMFIDSHIKEYNINVTNKAFANVTNQSMKLTGQIEDMKGASKPSDVSPTNAWDTLISSVANIPQLIWLSTGLIKEVGSEIEDLFQIPPVFMGLFMLLLALGIIWGIVYLFFRYKPW